MTQTKKHIEDVKEKERENIIVRKTRRKVMMSEPTCHIRECFVVGRREFIGGVLHFLISQLFPHHETIEAGVSAYLPPRYHIIPVE